MYVFMRIGTHSTLSPQLVGAARHIRLYEKRFAAERSGSQLSASEYTLMVSGLPTQLGSEDLRAFFAQWGAAEEKIMKGPTSQSDGIVTISLARQVH